MEPIKIVRLKECARLQWPRLLKRSELDVGSVLLRVIKIVSDVRRDGDAALLEYIERFDGVKLRSEELRVSEDEIRAAYEELDEATVKAIRSAAQAIKKFHLKQLPREWFSELGPGVKAGQLVRPLASVGVYAPGGLARYPSSLLMAVIPAKIVGVEKIIVCTPPRRDKKIDAAMLVAADVAGADTIFKVGGSQAIAAMAYGTETIPKVDKIVGPGNIYVVAAKQVVAPDVDVDFAAGPSEVIILADDSAEPAFIAADIIAQSEHDTDAAAVLVTISEKLASKVSKLVQSMLEESPRKQIVLRSLNKYGQIVVARDMDEAIEFVNAYAPEHLELMIKQPRPMLKRIQNAGAIFLGSFSPVAAGDFAVGPNHILPTGGAARKRSGLSVLDFVKLPTVQEISKSGLKRLAPIVERFAEAEGLPGHARSIKERFRGD